MYYSWLYMIIYVQVYTLFTTWNAGWWYVEMPVDDMRELPLTPLTSISDVALCSLQSRNWWNGLHMIQNQPTPCPKDTNKNWNSTWSFRRRDSPLLRMVLACSMAKKQMQDYKNKSKTIQPEKTWAKGRAKAGQNGQSAALKKYVEQR